MTDRISREVTEALDAALRGEKYSGEFLTSKMSGEDIKIYCLMPNGKSNRFFMLVWEEEQAGEKNKYVDIDPTELPEYGEQSRKIAESFLSDNGFNLELKVEDVWFSWKKKSFCTVRRNEQ